MLAFDRLTPNEQVLLLGFLPLLGATTQLGAALTASLVVVACMLALHALHGRLGDRLDPGPLWALHAAVSYGIAHGLVALMGFVVPFSETAALYLRLSGWTPLAFCGACGGRSPRQLRELGLRFVGWALLFGLVRETLGSGTLLGRALWTPGTAPVGLFATSAGALVLMGLAACPAAIFVRSAPSRPEGAS